MIKTFHVVSSILGEASASRRLSASVVAELQTSNAAADTAYRDLVAAPFPHLMGEVLAARGLDPAEQSDDTRRLLDRDAAALEEFLAADFVVVSAPMYISAFRPSSRSGSIASPSPARHLSSPKKGTERPRGRKTVIVASSRGGYYGAAPMSAFDHQETYLAGVFGFMGITDIRFIRAEGVNVCQENRQQAVEAAEQRVPALVAAA